MIETRNTIIKMLHEHMGIPVIAGNNTQNRKEYPFVDYSIITLVQFDGQGNEVIEGLELDIKNTLELQPKLSISFNAYSRNETEAYETAKMVSNYFRHIGHDELGWSGVVVVDVMDIMNRTILEVDKYEFRYGLDVMFRFRDDIIRIDREILDYTIKENEE